MACLNIIGACSVDSLPRSKARTISKPMIIGGLPRRSSRAGGGGTLRMAPVFTSAARGIFMGGSGGGFLLQASKRKRLAMVCSELGRQQEPCADNCDAKHIASDAIYRDVVTLCGVH